MTTATATTFDFILDTFKSNQLTRVDFTFNNGSGIDFTVYPVSSSFDYNDDQQVDLIKLAILTIVDDAFPQINNITEVGGSIINHNNTNLEFEGDVTSILPVSTTLVS